MDALLAIYFDVPGSPLVAQPVARSGRVQVGLKERGRGGGTTSVAPLELFFCWIWRGAT